MKPKPLVTAAAAACALLHALAAPALAAPHGEETPVNLKDVPAVQSGSSGGGSLVRTVVGLAVVIGVIYGLYWVLKQVKASREEKASGRGLAPLATLPLGPSRSLQLVRAGREIVLVGVSEHGVTPVRTYSEDEAEAVGLLDDDEGAVDVPPPGRGAAEALRGAVDELRRRTVRR